MISELTNMKDITDSDKLPKLSIKQEKAITLVLGASTVTDGLRQAKTSRAIWYSWMSDPYFRSQFEARQREILNDALHALRACLGRSVELLAELMNQKDAHPATKARVALSVLEMVFKADATEDLRRRVEVLESERR